VRSVAPANPASIGPISGESLYRDVIAYYNIGEHRAASVSDLQTSNWLARELKAAGLSSALQRFKFQQYFPLATTLKLADANVRAFPLWPPRVTPSSGIRSALETFDRQTGPRNLNGQFAVVRFPFNARAAVTAGSGHAELINAAVKSGASAIIAITESATGEIIALNVDPTVERWPVPVVLVGGRDQELLLGAARKKIEATLRVEGKYENQAEAANVIARAGRGDRLIVISTPQSGWFRCAAERGPGIALFLGLARWAARRASDTGFLFVSTSAHELGGLGMEAFLKELAPKPDRLLFWVHLGAGIAAYTWEDTANGPRRLREVDARRILMTTKQLEPVLVETFAGLPGLTPTPGRAVGEFELLARAGYRAFGIAGAHKFHHTPADSPEMTGPEILEPVATALVKTIDALESATQKK
jgi:hypothetical protein